MLTEQSIFEKTKLQISRISYSQLKRAAGEIKRTGKCTDPNIFALERQVQVVTRLAPNSYAKCHEQAVYIKALMVNNGMPVLWITLNPSDLKSALVLTLAGVQISDANAGSESASRFRAATATMNPVAVAQFFEATCATVFDGLLHDGVSGTGFLGPVSTYFGTVETNGQGMLRLHCLIWLKRFYYLATFQRQLVSEPQYKRQMVEYLDHIVNCSIQSDGLMLDISSEAPPADLAETNQQFNNKLAADSNAVAAKCQMHSTTHNATCFKYGAATTKKFRFNFPRPIVERTHISDLGVIEICRNNGWVNSWNTALALLIRSNHNITFILSTIKALALVRYITNYATKKDCDQYQRVLAFAIARKSLEKTLQRPKPLTKGNSEEVAPNQTSTLGDHDKFALRAFNWISHEREISSPLAANILLKLPEYYTPGNMTLKKISTDSIRHKFQAIVFPGFSDNLKTRHRIGKSARKPATLFDYYQYRGSQFDSFLLFDYMKLVTVVTEKKPTTFHFLNIIFTQIVCFNVHWTFNLHAVF